MLRSTLAVALILGAAHAAAFASQDEEPVPAAAGTAGAGTAAVVQEDDPDVDVNRAQPDFTVIGLPTTLRLPARKSAFRITHRFGRPLGDGDFGDLVEDFFGFDSGAQIGFEYRYGLLRATQLAVHRTNDRTIQFLLQRQIRGQGGSVPVSLDVFGSVEGTDNFKDRYSPGIGVIVSREFTDRAAVYAQPIWINNTNPLPSELVEDNDALLLGLGARLRLTASLYGVFEVAPRVAGYDPGRRHVAFGLEKRLGGHSFQINISNGFGTTFGQIARGGGEDWHIGFNLSRKFY
jgi:hypothetical protein